VTRSFDRREAETRFSQAGDDARDDARDDDGMRLEDDPLTFEYLEVAHILPHSLTRIREVQSWYVTLASPRHQDTSKFAQDASKQAALAILNMFDDGVGHLIEGADIDRPRNALTLARTIHQYIGNSKIFFEPVPDSEPHTYRIGAFLRLCTVRGILPVTRALYFTEHRTIDPPSSRLLAIHSAIGHILHLSAAGGYIDKILEDMEGGTGHAQADGSTGLGRLVHLGLWLDGGIDAYRSGSL